MIKNLVCSPAMHLAAILPSAAQALTAGIYLIQHDGAATKVSVR